MKRTIFVLLVLFAGMAATASADTAYTLTLGPTGCSPASCNGYEFTTTVTESVLGTYHMTFQVTDMNSPTDVPAYFQGFGLTLFSNSITSATFNSGASTAGLSSYINSIAINDKFNNGNNQCTGSSNSGSICVSVTLNGGWLLNASNPTVLFDFTIHTATTNSSGVLDSWHVMANGTGKSGGKGGNVFALTNDGRPTVDQPPPIPEPASMTLLGSGLLGAGSYLRRRFGR